jgi:hypothetical protein
MVKQSSGVVVYCLFYSGFYFDGGDDLLSIHKTKDGAKAARKKQIARGMYTSYDLDIRKFELED